MTKHSSDQISQFRKIFRRFGMKSDGSITHMELVALIRSLGLRPVGDQLHSLLAAIDSNGNGSVEIDKLAVAILPDVDAEVLINQEQLLQVFRDFDRDDNSYITASELVGSMAKLGHPLSYKELFDMMREADDRVLGFNKFANFMARSAADFFAVV